MIKHISLIMDGNRRWAKAQGLKVFNGHRKGLDAIRTVCNYAIDNSIEHVSLYTFSLENLNRPLLEREYLFSLIIDQAETLAPELEAKGIRIRFLGDASHYPPAVVAAIYSLEKRTEHCTGLQLNLLFCYGGRQDIVSATKKIAAAVAAGTLSIDKIDQTLISNNLQTAGLPDPDIVVRTGGMHRLSNFLPYESVYSELYFIDILWPDITREDIDQIVQNFYTRKRNFGI